MPPPVVTEFTIDARGSEAGANAYARSMDLAEAAAERVANQGRMVDQIVTKQTATMTRVAGSTSSASRSFDRLRNSVDPAARAQSAMERATRNVDRTVATGTTNQREAARVLDLVRQKYDRAGKEAVQYSHGANRASASTDRMSRTTRRLVGMMATLGVALGVRQIIQYADAWTNAGNRIAAVSEAAGDDIARVRTELADLAVETRASFDATITLYSRLAMAAQSLGAYEAELFTIVRTVNEAMTLSGASAGESAGAIRQLGQTLGSGALRGDELNSILEQAPILAKAVAEEMGVSVTRLRELGVEDAITSQIVFDALLNAAAGIHQSFSETETTVAQAMTNLETRFIEFVGGANDATGATKGLVNIIQVLADNIDNVIIALGVMAAAFVVSRIIAGIESILAAMVALRAAMAFLVTNPYGIAITALAAIAGGVIYLTSRQEEANVTMERHREIVDQVKEAYDRAAGAVDDWASRIEDVTLTEALVDLTTRQEEMLEAQRAFLGDRVKVGDAVRGVRRQVIWNR